MVRAYTRDHAPEIRRLSKDARRIGVFGASGCGKTYLATSFLPERGNVIIVDPKCEITQKGYAVVDTVSGFLDAAAKQLPLRVIITGKDVNIVGRTVARFCFDYARQPLTLFIDECQEICPSGTARRDPANPILTIARMGRSRGISLIVASQRITAVDVNLRGNMNDLFLFRQGDFSDAQTVKRMIGVDLFSLPPREFYLKTDCGGVTHYRRAQDFLQKAVKNGRKGGQE